MMMLQNPLLNVSTPKALRRQVLSRLALAGIVIGLIAGAISYTIERRHIETSVFAKVLESAQRFNTKEYRLHFIGAYEGNSLGLKRLLDDSPFLAMRVLNSSGRSQVETWKSASAGLRLSMEEHAYSPDNDGSNHLDWLQIGDDQFIRVVIPLAETEGKPKIYLDAVFPIEARLRQEHDKRTRNSVLFALVSALATSGLLYPILLGLMKRSLNLSSTLLGSHIELIGTLGSAIAKRDSDTDSHNYRVTLYAIRLARILARPRDELQSLIVGAFLHDIGKIGIPDAILLKPGRLTEKEFLIMKQHVVLGQQIVANNHWLQKAVPVITCHHEKFDGTGYPDGLCGVEIPLAARIFAIVDVFDALTSVRPYKSALPLDEAKRILQEGRGTHFDPAITDAFLKNVVRVYDEIGNASHDTLVARLRVEIEYYFGPT